MSPAATVVGKPKRDKLSVHRLPWPLPWRFFFSLSLVQWQSSILIVWLGNKNGFRVSSLELVKVLDIMRKKANKTSENVANSWKIFDPISPPFLCSQFILTKLNKFSTNASTFFTLTGRQLQSLAWFIYKCHKIFGIKILRYTARLCIRFFRPKINAGDNN